MASGSLILSDGTRQRELVGGSDAWLRSFDPPLPANDNTYAEGADSEGRRRVRSRPTNPEGSLTIAFGGADQATFWDNVANVEDLVVSVHERKGTLIYTPPGGSAVTFDLEAIRFTERPQIGHLLRQRFAEATITFEIRPYARLGAASLTATPVSLAGPIGSLLLEDVPGNVDAWGDLTLTETSSERREHVEVGVHEIAPGYVGIQRNLVLNPRVQNDLAGLDTSLSTPEFWTNQAITREAAPWSEADFCVRVTGTKDNNTTARNLYSSMTPLWDTGDEGVPVSGGTLLGIEFDLNVPESGSVGLRAEAQYADSGGSFLSGDTDVSEYYMGTLLDRIRWVAGPAPAAATHVFIYLVYRTAVANDLVTYEFTRMLIEEV